MRRPGRGAAVVALASLLLAVLPTATVGEASAELPWSVACGAPVTTRWSDGCPAEWRSSAHGVGGVYGLAVAPDGARVFVAGAGWGGTSAYDFATVAYDATGGGELWSERREGVPEGWDAATAIGVSPDGKKVFVAGYVDGIRPVFSIHPKGMATIAYDAATGSETWAARHNGTPYAAAQALAVAPDGSRVYVTGWDTGEGTGSDYATIAYDAATGQELWVSRYDGFGAPLSGTARAVAVSSDGATVFVTGWTLLCHPIESTDCYTSQSRRYFATVAYEAATGAERWVALSNGVYGSAFIWFGAPLLGVSPDGSSVFVTGPSGSGAAWVYAYDGASGAMRWGQRVAAVSASGLVTAYSNAYALTVSPGGSRVFVAGELWDLRSSGSWDYGTVAFDAGSGRRLWAAAYGTPRLDDSATAVVSSPDGDTVFVTGQSTGVHADVGGASSLDYATVAYDAETGLERWGARYGTPSYDSPWFGTMGVSPDGARLFVTGYSAGWTTLAYDTLRGPAGKPTPADPLGPDDARVDLGAPGPAPVAQTAATTSYPFAPSDAPETEEGAR